MTENEQTERRKTGFNRNLLWIFAAVFIFAADRITKDLIAQKIGEGESIKVINGFFNITNVSNTGAAWGLFKNSRIPLLVITSVILVTVILFFIKNGRKNPFLSASLMILAGGASGNLYERILKGGVTDFLDFYFRSNHFPSFNIADMSIVAGSCLLAFYLIFIYKESPKEQETGEKGKQHGG